MRSIELALIYETERNDHLDPRDKIKYGQEINSIFENLSKNEKIKESLEKDIHTFNSSSKDTLIEALQLNKQRLEIQIGNNNRFIKYSNEQKAMFNIEIETAISEIETAQKEIKTIREKYLGKAVI